MMQHFKRLFALAAVTVIAITGLTTVIAGPASAAVIQKSCENDAQVPVYYAEADATIKLCVQFDGIHLNVVADIVSGLFGFNATVRLIQCGKRCDPLNPPTTQFVPSFSHRIVPTRLFTAARGHVYYGELTIFNVTHRTLNLVVPCPC
jgi:hypothetical protein